LLIHGAGAYAGLFAPCVAELERTHHLLCYDRRGCSRSVHGPVRDFALHVRDALTLVRDRIGEPVHVVGWSAGATVALHLAIAHPDWVSSLVLAEPPLQLKAPRPLALGAVVRWELTRAFKGPRAGAESFYRWVSQYRGEGRNAFEAYPETWREEMLRNFPALFAEIRVGSGALGEGLRRADLAALPMPIQILLGERSAPVFAPAARYLARVAPRSVLHPIPEASHMLPTDRPDAVAQAVRHATGVAA
jgi:pimeloyl-ACP methyl ester carboxylesterase